MSSSRTSPGMFIAGHDRSLYSAVTVGAALAAVAATVLISGTQAELETKTRAFSALIASFLIVSTVIHFWFSRLVVKPLQKPVEERGLDLLDEASDLLAGKLNTQDAFRLIASRIGEMLPVRNATLFFLDETRSGLIVAASNRQAAPTARESDLAENAKCNVTVAAANVPGPAVALPLVRNGNVFAVFHFDLADGFDAEAVAASTYEGIAERVGPLILSAQSLDRSRANALTDATTDLPNERAFHLILENQVAEATRKRNERPLTILSFDIKGFDELNSRFGHAAGDRALSFVAQCVQEHLRQMDFFARASGDEFLAILPTASKEVSHEVTARLRAALFGRKFKIADGQLVELELNFGWASYGEDGEDADTLLAVARVRKDQAKNAGPTKVLWFPAERAL